MEQPIWRADSSFWYTPCNNAHSDQNPSVTSQIVRMFIVMCCLPVGWWLPNYLSIFWAVECGFQQLRGPNPDPIGIFRFDSSPADNRTKTYAESECCPDGMWPERARGRITKQDSQLVVLQWYDDQKPMHDQVTDFKFQRWIIQREHGKSSDAVSPSIWVLLLVRLLEAENNLKSIVRSILGRRDKTDYGESSAKVGWLMPERVSAAYFREFCIECPCRGRNRHWDRIGPPCRTHVGVRRWSKNIEDMENGE